METFSFDKLLVKTAFCFMTTNGNLTKRSISMITKICETSLWLQDFNFRDEINLLVSNIRPLRKKFISDYLDLLSVSSLTEKEGIALIDFAIKTIKLNEQIDYKTIQMFKKIMKRLKVNEEAIMALFPEIEQYLEEDNIRETYLEKISSQYLKFSVKPRYELIPVFKVGFPVPE